MVSPDKVTKILVKIFPEFTKTKYWADFTSIDYEEDLIKFHGAMSAFTDYVTELLSLNKLNGKIKKVFSLAEFFICNGNDSIKGGVTASFLKNLINYASVGKLTPE